MLNGNQCACTNTNIDDVRIRQRDDNAINNSTIAQVDFVTPRKTAQREDQQHSREWATSTDNHIHVQSPSLRLLTELLYDRKTKRTTIKERRSRKDES
jgi:hypothetical protein